MPVSRIAVVWRLISGYGYTTKTLWRSHNIFTGNRGLRGKYPAALCASSVPICWHLYNSVVKFIIARFGHLAIF